jgi:hypothetical protein
LTLKIIQRQTNGVNRNGTGEWHDLPTKEAPSWAVGESHRRKNLYKDGNRKAYRLTSSEMEETWEAEGTPEPEGIFEDHPIDHPIEEGG